TPVRISLFTRCRDEAVLDAITVHVVTADDVMIVYSGNHRPFGRAGCVDRLPYLRAAAFRGTDQQKSVTHAARIHIVPDDLVGPVDTQRVRRGAARVVERVVRAGVQVEAVDPG